jgi:hypothetical protein
MSEGVGDARADEVEIGKEDQTDWLFQRTGAKRKMRRRQKARLRSLG